MFRILSNLFILIAVFVLPIYISVFFVILSVFIFNNFIESGVFGFIIDLLYGSGYFFNLHFAYGFTIVMVIFYLVSIKLKTAVRFSI